MASRFENTVDSQAIFEDSLKRHELLSEVSLTLNYVDDFEGSVNRALALIGAFSDVSRIYIFEDDEAGLTTTNTFEWCNQGIEPQIQNLQVIPYEYIPEWKMNLDRDGFIRATDIRVELPRQLLDILEPQGILSILILPILFGPGLRKGFIGFDQCDRHRVWETAEFELLRTCAGLLGNAFRRRHADRELQSSERRYRALLEAQVDLVARFNGSGEITYVNQACCNLLDLLPDQLIGRNISRLGLVRSEDRQPGRAAIRKMLTKTPHRSYIESGIRVHDGIKWFGWELFGIREADGWPDEVQATGRDITAQVEYRRRLEEESVRARKASQAKSQFISKVSHELRTPLNSILGFSELLTMTGLPVKPMNYVSSIQKSARHLRQLIDNLLDFSRIDSGKVQLNYSDCSLQAIVDHVVKTCAAGLTPGVLVYISLAQDFPEVISMDELKFRKILTNLMENAVKFTKMGSITVAAGYENLTTETIDLLLSVRDTGIGIPEDRLTQVFQSFEQVDQDGFVHTTGTGVGLSIVKAYVEMFGGTIQVTSALEKGSSFIINLPGIRYRYSQPQSANPFRNSAGLLRTEPDHESGIPSGKAYQQEIAGDAPEQPWNPELLDLYVNLKNELPLQPEIAAAFNEALGPMLDQALASHSLTDIRQLLKGMSLFRRNHDFRSLPPILDHLANSLDYYDIHSIETHLKGLSSFRENREAVQSYNP